jgi:hypothetical protein
MGALLKFIFYSLAFTWIYNNFLRPLFASIAPAPKAHQNHNQQNTTNTSQDVIIKPKSKNDGGEYIDYEEIKQ